MRLVGKAQTLSRAQQFSKRLQRLDIDHNLEPHSKRDGRWQVWVLSENCLERARDEWCQFERDVGFIDLSASPPSSILEISPSALKSAPLSFEKTWLDSSRKRGSAPLTFSIALFGCCVWLLHLTGLEEGRFLWNQLGPQLTLGYLERARSALTPYLGGIFEAQLLGKVDIWRLLLANFEFRNTAELIFQLTWFALFANQIEKRIGTLRFAGLLLIGLSATSSIENLLSNSALAGLSGLNCLLVAFCYTRYKLSPWEGYHLPSWSLSFIALYLAICLSWQIALGCSRAAVAHAALMDPGLHNISHLSGLVVGRWLARVPFAQIKS